MVHSALFSALWITSFLNEIQISFFQEIISKAIRYQSWFDVQDSIFYKAKKNVILNQIEIWDNCESSFPILYVWNIMLVGLRPTYFPDDWCSTGTLFEAHQWHASNFY